MSFLLKNYRMPAQLVIVLAMLSLAANAQQQSLTLDDIKEESVAVKDAFNGPLIIQNQSTYMLQKKRLDLIFGHRFGKINEGAFNAFGLDQGFIRIGLEYGIKDWLTAGIGRSSLGKNFDFYLKNRLVMQKSPASSTSPVSVVIFLGTAFSSNELRRQNDIKDGGQFVNQLVHTAQASVSRKFSNRFSAQVTGTMIHRNTAPSPLYGNDVYAISSGTRLKVSNRIHLLLEYNYVVDKPDGFHDPMAIGMDIVAGAHVFNIHFANSAGIIEKEYMTATTDPISDGVRLGFTIRRSFMLKSNVEGGKLQY